MKRLILASFATIAMLASCEKESVMDSALVDNQKIKFAPYAGASVTRGTAVGDNTEFKAINSGKFNVAAYKGTEAYFGFRPVSWSGSAWVNGSEMYWPNVTSTLHFGAYFPAASACFITGEEPAFDHTSANSLTFGYNVAATVGAQEDLMYAISDYEYEAPKDSELTTDTDDAEVGLHFKHALTQIAFTATKSSDISVTVKSIKICNVVNNGAFEASANTNNSGVINSDQDSNVATSAGDIWTPALATTVANLSHYAVEFDAAAPVTGIAIDPTNSSATTTISDGDDVMMLLPQALTKWDAKPATPTGSTDDFVAGTATFLAINCTITHSDGDAAIIDGTIFVPFGTENIVYDTTTTASKWLPGYKLTYNLDFGGGFTIPGKPTPGDPTPGTTPNPDKVIETLRNVKYTVTVDNWIPVTVTPDVAM